MKRYIQEPTIRSATIDDILPLRKMHTQSWLDTYISPENGVSEKWILERTATWVTPENVAKWQHRLENGINDNPDQLHKVAVDSNDSVVGMVHASRDEEGQHLHAIYMFKEYFGSGLAQRLMDQVIDWSDPSQPIHLEVATYNERAKAFYRKYRFREVPGSESKFVGVIPTIKMEREREGETV